VEKFTSIKGIAAPMPIANIDTDMIAPKLLLKSVTKFGLSWGLFREHRFHDNGTEKPDFILNQDPWRHAKIIVALENFGCGSSREHAPWALYDFGFRCIIAPSFADIFYNNCFKNGLLPISLSPEAVNEVMVDAKAGREVGVDLLSQAVTLDDGRVFIFEIEGFLKYCLLNGLDDIGITLGKVEKIDRFEELQQLRHPWLYDRSSLSVTR